MENISQFCSFICHQHLSHSFYVDNVQFPLCVRCTSLYLSCVAMLIVLLLYLQFCRISILFPSTKGLLLLFFFIFLIWVDVFTGYFRICISNTISRLITGFFCGSSLMLLTISLISLYLNRKTKFFCEKSFLSIKEIIRLILSASIFFLILICSLSFGDFFFFVISFVCLIGYFLFYFCIVYCLLFLVLKLE